MSSKLRDIPGFLRFVLRRWSEDRCPQIAGSLTYLTLLAMFPMFGVVVAILSQSPVFEDVMSAIKIWLLMNFVPEIAGKIITVYMEELAGHAARLTWYGIGVVLVLAVWTMHLMDRSFNAIWRTARARSYWAMLVGYVAMLVSGPLLLLASVTFTTYVMALADDVPHWARYANGVFALALPVAMSAAAFFLLYRIVPHRKVPWRHALLGAVAAAVFFEGAKHVLGYLVRHSPTYSIAYGAFAAFPAFLVWLYVTWLGVLLGAELTASAAYWHGGLWKHSSTPTVRFREALAITQALIEAGAASLSFKRLQEATRLPARELEETLAQMVDGNVVVETTQDAYTLTEATRDVLATKPNPQPKPKAPVRRGRRGRGRNAASSR